MSLRYSPHLALIVATLALLPVGCGSDEVKVKEVPAAELTPPPPQEKRVSQELRPRKGSSSGMNYNPGGPPPGASVE